MTHASPQSRLAARADWAPTAPPATRKQTYANLLPRTALLQEALHDLAQNLGFQGGLYVHLGHAIRIPDQSGPITPVRFVASSVSDRLLYLETGALAFDPVAARAVNAHTPYAWTTALEPHLSESQRQLHLRLRGRGIQAGVAAPVQDYAAGPAYLSLYSGFAGEAERLVRDNGPMLAFVAASFHRRAKAALPATGHNAKSPALTAREIDCLRLAALGHTAPETAKALKLTVRTVEFHLKNAADKFGAPNKVRAVALAVSCGLIEP